MYQTCAYTRLKVVVCIAAYAVREIKTESKEQLTKSSPESAPEAMDSLLTERGIRAAPPGRGAIAASSASFFFSFANIFPLCSTEMARDFEKPLSPIRLIH